MQPNPSMFSVAISQLLEKVNEDKQPKQPKVVTKNVTTRVIKIQNGPKKNRKAEKFNMLMSILAEARDNNTYASREMIAEKIGATPGSVGVMISEIRKDKSICIEISKKGYRLSRNVQAA